MPTDYHNHLEKGTLTLDYLKKFVDEARSKNIPNFGISEHAYHFYQTKDIVSKPWMEERRYYDMEDYVKLFHEAWNNDLDVKMSIEMDYTPVAIKRWSSLSQTMILIMSLVLSTG